MITIKVDLIRPLNAQFNWVVCFNNIQFIEQTALKYNRSSIPYVIIIKTNTNTICIVGMSNVLFKDLIIIIIKCPEEKAYP